MKPWRETENGAALAVRLTPKGGRDAIEGVETRDDGRPVLKARVRAAPEDGAANAALCKLLAKALGVPNSAVVIGAGHTARIKTLEIAGESAALAERLAAICRK